MKKAFDLPYAITLVAIFVTGFASAGMAALKPLIVGALIDSYHFSPSQAGFVAGIEMAGVGVGAFIVATIGVFWNRRLVIIGGAILGMLGSIAPAVTDAFMPIMIARLVAGLGCGLIASIVLAVIGTTRDPDRTFGLYYTVSYAGMALLVPAGIFALAHFAVAGIYVLLALLLLIPCIVAQRIPTAVPGLRSDGGSQTRPPFPLLAGIVSLGLSFIFWIGFGAIWAFMERLGVQAGLDQLAVGGALSSGPLASIAGAMTVSALHTRFGRAPLLVASVLMAMASVVLLGWGSSATLFALGVLLLSFMWPVFLAYLGGTMALLDPAGRIIAMSVTSQTIGMAVGPAIGGVAAGMFGYVAIAVLGLVSFGLTLVLVWPLMARARAAAAPAAA